MILKGDRQHVEGYLRKLADLMGLRDWVIRLGEGTPDNDGAFAAVQTYTRIREGVVYLSDGWENATPETFRMYMVHELIHCQLESMEGPLTMLADTVGSAAYDVAYRAYREVEEVAVHAIARSWAETLPLPESKSKKRKAKV